MTRTGSKGEAPKATLRDVAARVGVSAMTVSRVFNDDARVALETRDKVLRAARQLEYRPNIFARGLASDRSYVLGLFYANPSANYISELVVGALRQCRADGYHLVIEPGSESPSKWGRELAKFVAESRVDGIIVPTPLCDAPGIVKTLSTLPVPAVRVAPSRDLEVTPYVWMDDRLAAHRMTEHLISRGHRRIGFIKGHPDVGSSEERYRGFLDAMRAQGLTPAAAHHVQQGYFTYRSGLEAAQRMLRPRSRPTAIFAANDDMAAGALAAALELGLKVPRQLSVAGFDDTQIATTIWPALTTIRQPIATMAEEAVRVLTAKDGHRRAEPQRALPRRHAVEFSLVERDSVARAE